MTMGRRTLLAGLAGTLAACGRAPLGSTLRANGRVRIAVASFSVSRDPAIVTMIRGWSEEAADNPELRSELGRPLRQFEADLGRHGTVVPAAEYMARPGYAALEGADPERHLTPIVDGHSMRVFTSGSDRLNARLDPLQVRRIASAIEVDTIALVHARWGHRARLGGFTYATASLVVRVYSTAGEDAEWTREGLYMLRGSEDRHHTLSREDLNPWVMATLDGLHSLATT